MPFSDLAPVYQGPLLSIRQWEQPLRNGGSATFERCTRPDTVAVIAFLDRDTVLLTQERHPDQDTFFLDVPGGRVDSGEDHASAARRELAEEAGYIAQDVLCWETVTYGGLIQFKQSIFIAKGLTAVDYNASHDPTEEIQLQQRPFEELYQLSLKNGLRRSEVMLNVLRMRHDPEAQKRLQAFLSDT